MPLSVCPDCQAQVSDQAPACLKCGRPMASVPIAAAKTDVAKKRWVSSSTLYATVGFLLGSAIVWVGCRPGGREPPPEVCVGANDGTDPTRPILAATDRGFIDTRGGWGWGDKCYNSMKSGKWGWAKAECDEGIKMNPASPQPRASLLYNEGLVAKATGKLDEARRDFAASLSLRENAEVRAALNSLHAQ